MSPRERQGLVLALWAHCSRGHRQSPGVLLTFIKTDLGKYIPAILLIREPGWGG